MQLQSAAPGVFTASLLRTGLHAVWLGAVRDPAQAAGLCPGGPDEGKPASSRLILLIGFASFLEPTALLPLGFLRIYPIISVLKFFEAKKT